MPLNFDVVAQIQKNGRYQLRRWSAAKSAWIPIPDHGDTLYDEAEARRLLAEFRPEGDTYITCLQTILTRWLPLTEMPMNDGELWRMKGTRTEPGCPARG